MNSLNVILNIFETALNSSKSLISSKIRRKDIINELYLMISSSLLMICFCVSFVGIVIALEYSHHIKLIIGNDTLIPGFVMVMLTRELVPAITALLIVSKMGASMAAELGAMKNSEELDAYRLLGMNPIDFFIAPRVVASSIALMVLCVFSLSIAVMGAWIACVGFLNFTNGDFFVSLFTFTNSSDFILCFVKAGFFGWSIPVVSCTLGLRAAAGAEGVGLCTTDAVVYSSIWIIVFDFVITYLWSAL